MGGRTGYTQIENDTHRLERNESLADTSAALIFRIGTHSSSTHAMGRRAIHDPFDITRCRIIGVAPIFETKDLEIAAGSLEHVTGYACETGDGLLDSRTVVRVDACASRVVDGVFL